MGDLGAEPVDLGWCPFQKIAEGPGQYSDIPKTPKRELWVSLGRRRPPIAVVATEKIHGANMSVILSRPSGAGDVQVCYAKRSAVLQPGELFYEHEAALARLRPAFLDLHSWVHRQLDLGPSDTVVVYGELFGGWYPEDPPAWAGAQGSGRIDAHGRSYSHWPTLQLARPPAWCLVSAPAVQEGVYYSPNQTFAAFDVCAVRARPARQTPSGCPTYLSYKDFCTCCDTCRLPRTPHLLTGPWSEVDSIQLQFDSKMPSVLGLPTLPKGTNTAEGVVLKPATPCWAQYKGKPARVIYKRKHPKFHEIENIETPCPDAPPAMQLQHMLAGYASANRAHAAVSKVGLGVSPAELASLIADDAWDEFWQAGSATGHALYSQLTPGQIEELEALLVAKAADVVAALELLDHQAP
eukprot:gene2335-3165_t